MEKSGDIGWGFLIAGVAIWDAYATETLSGAVDRYLESKYMKYVAIGAVAVTAAHLLNVLPDKIDPFRSS